MPIRHEKGPESTLAIVKACPALQVQMRLFGQLVVGLMPITPKASNSLGIEEICRRFRHAKCNFSNAENE